MTEVKAPEYLYHYTTIDTLHHMFKKNESGKSFVEFRFTDYRFLNDAEEGTFFKKYMEKQSKKFKESLSSETRILFDEAVERVQSLLAGDNEYFYVMSFSELEDSMQFWRQDYAKNKGICLKINTSKMEGMKKEKKYPISSFVKVKYLRLNDGIESCFPELKNKLEKCAANIKSGVKTFEFYKYENWFELFPYDVKNFVWKSEKEWRLQIPDATHDSRKVFYEIDDKGIPRAKIWIDNPFEEIILGPTFSPQYINSIKKWLGDRGFDNVTVRCGEGVLNR